MKKTELSVDMRTQAEKELDSSVDRDTTNRPMPETKREKIDRMMDRLDYHEKKAEHYRRELRKLVI